MTNNPPPRENPYSPGSLVENEPAVFGDAHLVQSGFLYRVIDFPAPFKCRMVYSGWWFVQRVSVDGHLAWSKVSWINLATKIEFALPPRKDTLERLAADRDPLGHQVRIEITFRPGLVIRRFRVWIDDALSFDQLG